METSVATYLADIRKYPLLGRDEEAELGRKAREGDSVALERLVCANLRFVISVAKRYQHRGLSLADLIDEGNLGLIRAAERFDETKGVKFISYAVWWIRQSILRALAEQAQVVRMPSGLATRDHLARPDISFDEPLGTDANGTLLDYWCDDLAPSPDEVTDDSELMDSVTRALATLQPREALVLRLHFGLETGQEQTLEAIGERFGITRERVRQIKDRALSRLRRSRYAFALAGFRGP